MTINRKRLGGMIALAAAGLTTAAMTLPQAAQAQETVSGFAPQVEQKAMDSLTSTGLTKQEALHRLAVQMDNKVLANKLVDQLGSKSANYFLDRSGHAVVNVLDSASADEVRAAGATPKLVQNSAAELQSVKAKFDSIKSVPETAWGIDPRTNKVVVTISDAAPKAQAAKLTSFANSFGDAVRIKHATGDFKVQIAGGDEMTTGQIICSAGFNATQGGKDVIVDAGHCTRDLPTWQGLGPSLESDFPGTDYGLIQNDSGNSPGEVNLYDGSTQAISGPGDATVGEQVCKSGRTTQYTCGEVQALNQTVDYGQDGVVDGLIQTNVVTDSGDSGGPLFDGETALGMTSGGDGTTNFFQPVGPALQAYGATLK